MSRFESIEYTAPNGYEVKCLAMSVDSEDWKGLSVDEHWKGLSIDDNEQNLLEGDKRIYFWTDASARIFLGSLPTSDEYDTIKNKIKEKLGSEIMTNCHHIYIYNRQPPSGDNRFECIFFNPEQFTQGILNINSETLICKINEFFDEAKKNRC